MFFSVDSGGLSWLSFGEREQSESPSQEYQFPHLSCTVLGSELTKAAIAARAWPRNLAVGTSVTGVFSDGTETWTVECRARAWGGGNPACLPTVIFGGGNAPDSAIGECS